MSEAHAVDVSEILDGISEWRAAKWLSTVSDDILSEVAFRSESGRGPMKGAGEQWNVW